MIPLRRYKNVVVVLLNLILSVPHPFPFSPPTPTLSLASFIFVLFFVFLSRLQESWLVLLLEQQHGQLINVGNEFGQVLISVLTVSEGSGLRNMASGIIRRYKLAGVPPPVLMYTDRDCCGERNVKSLFTAWDEVTVRLDAWHFMRRFAAGCTTESHPLYPKFMARLSQCIFEWSREDLNLLKQAKAGELVKSNVLNPSDEDFMKEITKPELALHVRRKTRGIQITTMLVANLLEAFSGPQGNDSLGVPLLDSDRIWSIWESQQKHISCIQDPDDVQLYNKTGTLIKGGVELPVYR